MINGVNLASDIYVSDQLIFFFGPPLKRRG